MWRSNERDTVKGLDSCGSCNRNNNSTRFAKDARGSFQCVFGASCCGQSRNPASHPWIRTNIRTPQRPSRRRWKNQVCNVAMLKLRRTCSPHEFVVLLGKPGQSLHNSSHRGGFASFVVRFDLRAATQGQLLLSLFASTENKEKERVQV